MTKKTAAFQGDIALCFGVCSDVFGQLAALIRVIERDVPEHGDTKKLLAMCANLAEDFENATDLYREEVEKNGVQNDHALKGGEA